MKITSFQLTLRQAITKDGYGDNYYVNIDDNGVASVSHPYKNIPHKEQAAILGVIQSAIIKYGLLVNECDKANRALKLEQYAPKVLAEVSTEIKDAPFEESTAEPAVPQPSHGTCSNNLDCTDLVAHSEAEQERLDMEEEIKDAPFEEVESGADRDIDNPASLVDEIETGDV